MTKRHHLLLILFVLATTMPLFAEADPIKFRNGEDSLSGHYLLPEYGEPKAVILFVHGDGLLDYDAYGYYPLIWERLLNQGFAIFSWDKPGVGKSTGHWLAQTMQQRQQEVQSAITFIRNSYGYTGAQVGLLGFSQAGWVVPALANNNPDVGFIIGIGFAINWLEQSWYLTRTRLIQQGADSTEIKTARRAHIQEIMFLQQQPSYDLYLKKYANTTNRMTEDRYQFILKNLSVNASQDYVGLKQPTLLLLGEKDLNVDILNTKEVIEKVIAEQPNIQISIIKNATHSLLNADDFNEKVPGLLFWLKLIWQGENAVAQQFYTVLDEWLSLQE